jgi:hypothetical protein
MATIKPPQKQEHASPEDDHHDRDTNRRPARKPAITPESVFGEFNLNFVSVAAECRP